MNTFGSSSLQFPLCDATYVKENRRRFRRESIKLLDRVTSFYCPTGRWGSRGWILLARSDYNQLNPYSTSLQLHIGNTTDPNNVSTLKNLSIIHAQCVTRGLSSDSNALYLVEITDDRSVVYNDWFQCPVTVSYNIRAPGYPQTFHPGSMNGGTTWTWSTMLSDLWGKMNTLDGGNVLGNFPGLPTTPTGTPEGFWLQGVPAWYAFNDILEYLGMTIACDLTKDQPFSIVIPGNPDTTFTNLQTRYILRNNLEDDLEWVDTGAARVPKTVTVLFRKRYSIYGTEETVRYDSPQWNMTPLYPVVITAPATFANAVGAHYIWSDFTVRYDQDGNALAADTTMANTIAQERVNQYFNKIYRQTSGFMTQTYSSALPFVTGSQVDGVCWFQDYRDEHYQGWKTQIVRGGYPPWPDIWD